VQLVSVTNRKPNSTQVTLSEQKREKQLSSEGNLMLGKQLSILKTLY